MTDVWIISNYSSSYEIMVKYDWHYEEDETYLVVKNKDVSIQWLDRNEEPILDPDEEEPEYVLYKTDNARSAFQLLESLTWHIGALNVHSN